MTRLRQEWGFYASMSLLALFAVGRMVGVV